MMLVCLNKLWFVVRMDVHIISLPRHLSIRLVVYHVTINILLMAAKARNRSKTNACKEDEVQKKIPFKLTALQSTDKVPLYLLWQSGRLLSQLLSIILAEMQLTAAFIESENIGCRLEL